MRTDRHLHIRINGQEYQAQSGHTIAAALLAAGVTTLRHTQNGAPRGQFCGMGVCFECLVTVDGVPGQQACMIPVKPDMVISTTDSENEL